MLGSATTNLQALTGCHRRLQQTTASVRNIECTQQHKTGPGDSSDRRQILRQAGALLAVTYARPAHAAKRGPPSGLADWSSPGLAAPVDPAAPRFFKTANGLKIQELALGTGPRAKAGDRLVLDYVLRRSNGYFIYATVEGVSFQPRDVPIGPLEGSGDIIPGMEEALTGMKPGAKRRIVIPPQLGYLAQLRRNTFDLSRSNEMDLP